MKALPIAAAAFLLAQCAPDAPDEPNAAPNSAAASGSARADAAPAHVPRGDCPAGLRVPVAGVAPSTLVDTFTDARSEGRVHDAIDIMAPAGTPVLAAAAGTVEKLFLSERGGITVYVRSPDKAWLYYYAHLQDYAPGLAQQANVKQGELLGHVGSTGNASPEAPHLHFAINAMAPGEGWWQGKPINPYPALTGRC